MQGWTPDFIPKITGDAVAMKLIHKLIPVPGAEAIRMSSELATKEGIFVGITSGATFAGALRVAAEAPKGANILAMLPDTGERYLSTPLFANVPADMTPEEVEISRSTPSAQFPLEGLARSQRLPIDVGSAVPCASLVIPGLVPRLDPASETSLG